MTVFFLLCFFASGPVAAQEKSTSFHVTGLVFHPEAPIPEVCFTLSADAKLTSREALAASIVLRKDGKRQKIDPKNLSLSPQDICLQKIDFGARYTVVLPPLKSAGGKGTSKKYEASFTLPDRKQALGFISVANPLFLPRYIKDNKTIGIAPVLRSVNIKAARLQLYRLDKRETFAGAWQKYIQSAISPSESLIYARDKGQKVFESDLVFAGTPNAVQTLEAPLPPQDVLTQGLYYLAAAPQDKKASDPGLFAGQWFLVSDLRMAALPVVGGVQLFASDFKTNKPLAGAAAFLMTREGKILAEGASNEQGSVFLPYGKDGENQAALALCQTASGHVDLLDLTPDKKLFESRAKVEAFLETDRAFYRPDGTATATLWATDWRGALTDFDGSVIKFFSPDGGVFSEQPVPRNKGVQTVSVPLPLAASGKNWRLAWMLPQGEVLAEKTVVLRQEGGVSSLDIEPDRRVIGADGAVSVMLRSLDENGAALPFRQGRLVARAIRPDHGAWRGYRFGVPVPDDAPPLKEINFMTGQDGRVTLPLQIDGKQDLQAVEITAWSDDKSEAKKIVLPLLVGRSLIGIKPDARETFLPGSQHVTFNVIALDAQGKRRAQDGLFYNIIEEGRSFEWLPAEGQWEYKPLPHHRRVGGGPLALSAGGENRVSWSLTPGHYILEVSDQAETILAQYAFDIGQRDFLPVSSSPEGFRFLTESDTLQAKVKNKISFRLDKPAMIGVVLADDQVRQSFQRSFPAGKNDLVITPSENWGRDVVLRMALMRSDDIAPQWVEKEMRLVQKQEQLGIILPKLPKKVTAGSEFVLPVRVQGVKEGQSVFVSLQALPTARDGSFLPSITTAPVLVDPKGLARPTFKVPSFDGTLRLRLKAWNDKQVASQTANLDVQQSLTITADGPAFLHVGDRGAFLITVQNNEAPRGLYHYKITGPDNLVVRGVLQGSWQFKKGQTKTFSLSLAPRGGVEGDIVFDLKGPSGADFHGSWPVTVHAPLTPLTVVAPRAFPQKKVEKLGGKAVLIAPYLVPDFVSALEAFVRVAPQTTREVAQWIETSFLVEKQIVDLGLMPLEHFKSLRQVRIRQIRQCQKEDGGFSAVAASDVSDMESTAAALGVLDAQADKTAAWLLKKLQNTWFDEEERSLRARAFLALAQAGKADVSALRYFAQTSEDKKYAPETAAAISLAFTLGARDEKASHAWAARVHQNDEGFSLETSRLLALNGALAAKDFSSLKTYVEDPALWLVAFVEMVSKQGSWHIEVDGKDQKIFGIFSSTLAQSKALKNNAERDLMLMETEPSKTPRDQESGEKTKTLSLHRTLYYLNGDPVPADESLDVGETYLVWMEGQGEARHVVIPSSSAYDLLLPLSQETLVRLYPWLPAAPNETGQHTQTARATGFVVEGQGPWRVALFLKPMRRGNYKLPPPMLRKEKGKALSVSTTEIRKEIR